MRRGALPALLSCALAAPAAAGPFDGLWRTNPTSPCVFTEGDAGVLKIEDDVLFGAEARCRMTGAVNVRDMDARLYDMVCSTGDSEWTDRALLMNAADGGLIVVWNGFAFAYSSCGDDSPAGTVTTADQIGITDGQD